VRSDYRSYYEERAALRRWRRECAVIGLAIAVGVLMTWWAWRAAPGWWVGP
jgi:hypothetical protein